MLKAQDFNALSMQHKKLHFSILIEQGAKVTIITDKQIKKGRLLKITDGWLLVGQDTVSFSAIDKLFARTYSSRFGGSLLAVAGASIDGIMIYTFCSLSAEGSILAFGLPIAFAGILGGTFLTVKAIQLLSRGRKFKTRAWNIVPTYATEEI